MSCCLTNTVSASPCSKESGCTNDSKGLDIIKKMIVKDIDNIWRRRIVSFLVFESILPPRNYLVTEIPYLKRMARSCISVS